MGEYQLDFHVFDTGIQAPVMFLDFQNAKSTDLALCVYFFRFSQVSKHPSGLDSSITITRKSVWSFRVDL